MTVVGNVLSADSLATLMASTLPKHDAPQIKTPFDAIALASHASMLAVGFRLIGLGDDDRITVDHAPSLPAQWNSNAPNYAFRYAHNQSSMEYLLKINRMANKAVVLAMALGDDKTATLDVKAVDYISEASLPFTLSQPQTTSLFNLFISNGRLSDYGSLMRINIVQKLMPSLQKEGYQESAREHPLRDDHQLPAHPLRDDRQPPVYPHPFHGPLAQLPPQFPHADFAPPGFEDPYDLNRPLRPMPAAPPALANIGERDLYPQGLGPRDPFGAPDPAFGAGGMHPTLPDFHHPRGRGTPYDPQVPPGSRYDPVGPGSPSGFRPPNPFNNFGNQDFL